MNDEIKKIRKNGPNKMTVKQSLGRRAWERWKIIAVRIGHFNSMILLTIAYFLAGGMSCLFVKFSKRNPLHRHFALWVERNERKADRTHAQQQF